MPQDTLNWALRPLQVTLHGWTPRQDLHMDPSGAHLREPSGGAHIQRGY